MNRVVKLAFAVAVTTGMALLGIYALTRFEFGRNIVAKSLA